MIKRKDEMEILHQEHACNGMNSIEKQFVFSTAEMSDKAKMFARITLPCGSSIGEHPHQPEAEIYYILKGEITVTDNDTRTVPSGRRHLHRQRRPSQRPQRKQRTR